MLAKCLIICYIQEQLVKAHGTQCGYCTPGFVMSMYTLLHNNPIPSMDQVQKAILGKASYYILYFVVI